MLTGDLALVEVQWTVFYRIADLQAYLFNVREVEATIRDLSESSMRAYWTPRGHEWSPLLPLH